MRKVLEGFDFTYLSHTFNQDEYTEMATALGIDSLDDEHRKVLQRQCNRFLPLVVSWEQASRPSEVRKKLEVVHSDVERLIKTLHALHDSDFSDKSVRQSALALLLSAAPDNDWNDCYGDNMFAFTERLAEIGMAANTALYELHGNKGGPPGDLPLEVLANALSDLFTVITKKSPSITTYPYAEPEGEFGGMFLDFVQVYLKPLPLQHHKSRRDLGQALKRILRARKRS